jgi:hypothetical protein
LTDIEVDSVLDFSTIESYPQGSFRALAEIKSSTVGVADALSDHQEFEINPNPAGSELYVKYNFSSSKPDIKIIDILGREVKSLSNTEFDAGEIIIPLDDIIPGCYFLVISDGKINSAKQFIKR